MAYDDRGNFIGDMHWRVDRDFDAGEEIQLDRGGVIVQVSDCVGQQSQDLSGLVDKRIQEREQRVLENDQRRTNTTPGRQSLPASRTDVRLQTGQPGPAAPLIRHRPLTALLGAPTGHHGRAALPCGSPFERRSRTDDTETNEGASRPLKRSKHDDTPPSKLGYARSLFGTTLTLSGAPPSSARMPSQSVPNHAQRMASPPRLPPPPSPELEVPVTPASTSFHESGNAAPRIPLHAIDERRTNSVALTTHRGLTQKAPDRHSLTHGAEKIGSTSRPDRWARSKSPPREVMDLTLSDNGNALSPPAVENRSRVTPFQRSGNASAPRLSLDGNKSRSRLAREPETLPPELDSSFEVDMPIVQPEAKFQEKSAQRTELRLNSKKRGLLVVSEQAIAKPAGKDAKDPRPMESLLSMRPNHHLGTVQRQVEQSPLEYPLATGADDELFERNTPRPESSATYNPGSYSEDEGHMHETRDEEDEAQNMEGEWEQGFGRKGHVLASKSRKTTLRGDASSDAHSVGEPQGGSSAYRRSMREPKQPQKSAPTAQPGNKTGQYGTVATTTALPAAPRFVRLSRKSVRSKELIGYDFSETNVGSGNGSFSVNPADKTRTDDPESPDHAEHHRLTRLTAEATGTADSVESVPQGTELKDRSVGRAGRDPGQTILHRSPSPFQQPLPAAQSERAQHGAQGSPAEESGIRATRAGATRTRDASQLGRDGMKAAHAPRVPDAKPTEPDNPGGQPRTREAVAKTATVASGAKEVAAQAVQAPRKLFNPATRGRKAALKSDAAGQVPQRVLPVDVELQAVQLARREQMRSMGSSDTGSSTSTPPAPPTIKMTFPGFVSAKGSGPWSREADDLLGTGRRG